MPNAFLACDIAHEVKLAEKMRAGIHREKPRLPVDHLMSERPTPTLKVRVTKRALNPASALMCDLRKALLASQGITPERPVVVFGNAHAKSAPEPPAMRDTTVAPKWGPEPNPRPVVSVESPEEKRKRIARAIRERHTIVTRNEFYVEHGHREGTPCVSGTCSHLDYPLD